MPRSCKLEIPYEKYVVNLVGTINKICCERNKNLSISKQSNNTFLAIMTVPDSVIRHYAIIVVDVEDSSFAVVTSIHGDMTVTASVSLQWTDDFNITADQIYNAIQFVMPWHEV